MTVGAKQIDTFVGWVGQNYASGIADAVRSKLAGTPPADESQMFNALEEVLAAGPRAERALSSDSRQVRFNSE